MVPCRCRGVLLYHAECAGFVKMEISASAIFRVEPFQHRLCGDSPSADGGNVPRPAAGQEGRHQGFYPLNSHFLLFLSPAQTRERRPLRKGEQQSGYHSVSFVKYSQFADSVLLHMSATLRRARHNRVAQFLGTLYRKAPANLSVWHNLSSWVLSVISKLTNCATQASPRGPSLALRAIHLVSRLRRVADMCSSRVTELRIGKRKGRTRSRSVLMRGKILCRSSFSKRSPVSGLRQTKKQRKRDSQGWKPWCPSLCPPPWVRR